MGTFIEFIFQKIYVAMLLSGIFLLLSLSAAFVFGIAPASSVVMSLFTTYRYDYKRYRWKEAWELFKENLIQANQLFTTFLLISALLIYGVYLLVQLPPTFLTLVFSILNLFFALFFLLAYTLYLKLQVYFSLSYKNWVKLSLMAVFMQIIPLIKLVVGTLLLLCIGYYLPAFFFFVLIGVWHFFVSDTLEPICELVKERLSM